jgi:hypothetical protein
VHPNDNRYAPAYDSLPPRLHFHRYCLGEAGDATPAEMRPLFKSLAQITTEFGLSNVALLKMDIEGSEYDVFEDFLKGFYAAGSAAVLPDQVLMEVHWKTHTALKWCVSVGRRAVKGGARLYSALSFSPQRSASPTHAHAPTRPPHPSSRAAGRTTSRGSPPATWGSCGRSWWRWATCPCRARTTSSARTAASLRSRAPSVDAARDCNYERYATATYVCMC